MADYYQQQANTDHIQLEDGSGNYLLEGATGGASIPTSIGFSRKVYYAAIATCFFWGVFTPPPVAAVPTEPSYHPPISQPSFDRRARGYRAAIDSCDGPQIIGSPADVTAPECSWDPIFPDSYPAKRYSRARFVNPSGVLVPVATSLQTFQETQQPLTRRVRPYLEPASSWSTFTPAVAEVILESEWNQLQSQPVYRRYSRAQFVRNTGALTPRPDVPVSSWAQPQSQPDFSARAKQFRSAIEACDGPQIIGSPADVTAPETSWNPKYPSVLFNPAKASRARYVNQSGVLVPVATSLQTFQEVQQPTRSVRRASFESACSWSTFTPAAEVVVISSWDPVFPDSITKKKYIFNFPYFFYNTSTAQENVTEDRWHQPVSQPYPYRRSLATAQQLAFFWHVSTAAESISEDRWHQPVSQPYPYKKNLRAEQQQSYVAPVSIQQEATTVDRWFQPPSQPTPAKTSQARFQLAPTVLSDVTEQCWQQPQSQPTYQKRLAASEQLSFIWSGFTPAAEIITVDKWFQPASQPYPYRRALPEAVRSSGAVWQISTDAETVFEPSWHQLIGQPTPAKYSRARFTRSTGVLVPREIVTVDKWFEPASQPTRRLVSSAQQLAFSWSTFTPAPEVILESEWHQPVSQPTYAKYNPARFQRNLEAQDIIVEQYWQQPVSQPVLTKRILPTGAIPYFFYNTSIAQETITADKFVQPISQPYPYKKGLSTADQAPYFRTDVVPESIFEDKWHQPVSQPYPYKKAIRTAAQQAFFWHISTQPEVVHTDAFVQPTSQPVRRTYRSAIYQQASASVTVDIFVGVQTQQPASVRSRTAVNAPYVAFNPFVAPAIVFESSWHQPISQPIPAKYSRSRYARNSGSLTPQERTSEYHWHQPISQPYSRIYRSAVYQLASQAPFVQENIFVDISEPIRRSYSSAVYTSASTTVFQVEQIFIDKWFQPVSQPYPYRKVFSTEQQKALYWNTSTPAQTTLDWFQETQQPYPYVKGLNRAFYSRTTGVLTQEEQVFEDKWHQPVSQPYPYTRKLGTAAQKPVFWITFTPAEVITQASWQGYWPQPYPYRRAINTANQIAEFWNTHILPPFPVVIIPISGTGTVIEAITGTSSISQGVHGAGSVSQGIKGSGSVSGIKGSGTVKKKVTGGPTDYDPPFILPEEEP